MTALRVRRSRNYYFNPAKIQVFPLIYCKSHNLFVTILIINHYFIQYFSVYSLLSFRNRGQVSCALDQFLHKIITKTRSHFPTITGAVIVHLRIQVVLATIFIYYIRIISLIFL